MMKDKPLLQNLVMLVAFLFVIAGCSKKTVRQSPSSGSGASNRNQQQLYQQCLDAARKVLGRHAEIVMFGAFNSPQVQEAVAVLRIDQTAGTKATGLFVAQLVILRHEASGWQVALTASKQVQNEAGFIGIDYIDDAFSFNGYRVLFPNQRADGKKAFTLSLSYLSKDGNTEGIPLEISWNSHVGRYQEFDMNSDPPGFKSEIKNPPHLKR